jgi:hypothetical protein
MGHFDDVCKAERDAALRRMDVRYSRAPEKRSEARLEMSVADTLQKRRPELVLTEFSFTWNRRMGALP